MVFHVICKLPNASELISGIEFVAHEVVDGVRHMWSAEPVEADVADQFRSIPGYEIIEATAPPQDSDPVAKRPVGRPPLKGAKWDARNIRDAAADKARDADDPAAAGPPSS